MEYTWSAFAFNFIVCLFLFLKTRKSLKKVEQEFKLEVAKLSEEKVETTEGKISKDILISQ